jgi:two-component system, chemotaxis family, CheB/CheR fusion protein
MAFREAIDTGRTIVRRGAIETDGTQPQLMSLTVAPLNDREDGEALFLFVFRGESSTASDDRLAPVASSAEGIAQGLERELAETKERLRSLIEEYETAVEELKSSNEELVSLNEEMQSAMSSWRHPRKNCSL